MTYAVISKKEASLKSEFGITLAKKWFGEKLATEAGIRGFISWVKIESGGWVKPTKNNGGYVEKRSGVVVLAALFSNGNTVLAIRTMDKTMETEKSLTFDLIEPALDSYAANGVHIDIRSNSTLSAQDRKDARSLSNDRNEKINKLQRKVNYAEDTYNNSREIRAKLRKEGKPEEAKELKSRLLDEYLDLRDELDSLKNTKH